METRLPTLIYIIVLSFYATVTASEILDSFGNVMGDPTNSLYKGQFFDHENNPLWSALKDGV